MTDEPVDVLATAKERFKRCVEHYSENREKAKADLRFAAASPDDPWQWEELQRKQRTLQQRPCLTINRLPQHIRQITNDIRLNRPSIRFRAADNEADPKVAEILMGVVRHIEANSDADIAYDTAAEYQVTSGEGYIRIVTDYIRDDSFDQDIFIRPVKNPFRVFLDPASEDPTGADARFAFVEDILTKEEYKAQFGKEDEIDWDGGDDWCTDEGVRICEYFEVTEKRETLYQWTSGATSFKGDDLPKGVMPGELPVRERQTMRRRVMWRKMNGQKVLDEKEFPSRYIPIIRVLGNEWIIDGKPVYSGIVRNAKDSQRMYNVAQSAIVERVLMAPKTPWVAAAEAIQGHEKSWQTANTANHAYLPYNHVDPEGNVIPAPARTAPATVEPGLTEVARSSADDIKAETGQYDASLGQRSNETSGKAILARQREGDNATYHYVDNLGRAIRHVGRIILDMYPRVYTERRVMTIVGEDGGSSIATMDPDLDQAVVESKGTDGALQRSFSPFVGTYDVYEGSGPGYATRRAEQVEAMTAMTQANPTLWGVIGDVLVQSMDWPGAEEMAKRLRATLVPQVQQVIEQEEGGQEMPPQAMQAMQQMQQQMQQLGQALQEAQGMAQQASSELESIKASKAIEAARLDIDRFRAETERMKLMQAGEIESAKIEGGIIEADMDADAERDVAALNGLVKMQIAGMQPDPALQAEAADSEGLA